MNKAKAIIGISAAIIFGAGIELYGRFAGYTEARVLFYDPRVGPYAEVERVGGIDPRECHVVIVGDSIVDGMRERLPAIANGADCAFSIVALGWWAPGNERRYFEAFGWPNASEMVLVINSDDLKSPWNERQSWSDQFDHPQASGAFGFIKSEILARIEYRIWPPVREPGEGLDDLELLVSGAVSNSPNVRIVWHPSDAESVEGAEPPQELLSIAQRYGIRIEHAEYAATDYADHLHLNESGKTVMAAFLRSLWL